MNEPDQHAVADNMTSFDQLLPLPSRRYLDGRNGFLILPSVILSSCTFSLQMMAIGSPKACPQKSAPSTKSPPGPGKTGHLSVGSIILIMWVQVVQCHFLRCKQKISVIIYCQFVETRALLRDCNFKCVNGRLKCIMFRIYRLRKKIWTNNKINHW